jgi:membrane-associated phospholipid phosphatase
MMMARVLGMLAPDKEEALIRRAGLIAYDRVVAGMHYPTDVSMGLGLGAMIADELARSAAFQADLTLARSEWAAATTPAGP